MTKLLTWLWDLFLSQAEQEVKSCGVEWGQRVEPCNVHLVLQASTGSILDALGTVCVLISKEKCQGRLLFDHTALKVECGPETQAFLTAF